MLAERFVLAEHRLQLTACYSSANEHCNRPTHLAVALAAAFAAAVTLLDVAALAAEEAALEVALAADAADVAPAAVAAASQHHYIAVSWLF